MVVGVEEVRLTNWSGSIPIVLSLAPTSLSSPTMPPAIHVMISRMTYLHVGLQSAVMRLCKFAPAVISIKGGVRNEPDPGTSSEDTEVSAAIKESSTSTYPVCWFEDEETQIALRWHLFTGVLYDLKRRKKAADLPWKIRVHFTSYPSSQILPLDAVDGVGTTLERTFNNSIKQALFVQHGSSKVAMSMSKQSHHCIWDSVVTSNYQLYQQVNSDLQVTSEQNSGSSGNGGGQILPVRLLVDSKPAIQRKCQAYMESCNDGTDHKVPCTLGSLLADWIPQFFKIEADGAFKPESSKIVYSIQGIQPPLSVCVKDLWQCLCHPDHFLYIVVTTR